MRFEANAAEPTTPGRVVVQAEFPTGATPPASLTVYYEVEKAASTALERIDFQPLSGVIVLTPDMLWFGAIEVVPIDDALVEGDERIVLRIKPDANTNYLVSPYWPSATLVLADNETPTPARASWFVATNGVDGSPNNGSLGKPFRTLPYAMEQARYGDTIYMRAGEYREAVNLDATGVGQFWHDLPGLEASVGSWTNMLTICNYNNEEVCIKGSDIVTGWQRTTSPDRQMGLWRVPWNVRSQQVFANGQLLGHVGWNVSLGLYPFSDAAASSNALSTLTNAVGMSVLQQTTAHMTNWSFFHDTSANYLYVALPTGTDPNRLLMEASTKQPFFVIYDYIRVKGLKFRHSNLMAMTGGWPGVALGFYGIFENCDVQWCDFMGLSVRDQSRITNCLIANNGMIGLSAVGTNIIVSGCRILTNHYLAFDFRSERAGAKIIGQPAYLDNSLWVNNEFAYNQNGAEGLWFDSMTVRDCNNGSLVLRNNALHHNGEEGLFIEFTSGVRIFNNLCVSNTLGEFCFANAADCWVFNNTLIGAYDNYAVLAISGSQASSALPLGLLPQRLYITNNIIAGDESAPEGDSPPSYQLIAVAPIGTCAGIDSVFWDNNCYLIKGQRSGQDYFDVNNYDRALGYTGSACRPENGWIRIDWPVWQGYGFDVHGLSFTDAATINAFFVNSAAGDFRISANCPAARAGKNLFRFLQNDFTYHPRPAIGNFSIGAYEFTDTVHIMATDPTAAEPGFDTGAFLITRESVDFSQPLTVLYSVGGSASGSDYVALSGSATIPAGQSNVTLIITPLSDVLIEPTETVVVSLSASPAYVVGSPGKATVQILNAPTVRVSAGNDATEPSRPGSFIISRDVVAATPLNVFFSLSGIAVMGIDYVAVNGVATIPAKKASVLVTITPIDDFLAEGKETITLTIQANAAYNAAGRTATINLLDNDPPSAPAGLTATAGDKHVTLNWNPSLTAISYKVKMATSTSGNFKVIATVTSTRYDNPGLKNGTSYYYKVSAVNGFGEGADSAAVAVIPHL